MQIEQKTITSIEVAEMVDKPHNDLMKDIRRYISQFGEGNLSHTDFFTESTYLSDQNKTLPCYQVSKKGCEFIAHKLTGIKGTEFTAKYINKFHDMEEKIKSNLLEGISPELEAIIMQDKKLQIVVKHIQEVDNDLQEFKKDMPLLGLECDEITAVVKSKGVSCLGGKASEAYQDKSLRSRVYSDIYSQLKREFAVTSYKAIKRGKTDIAIEIIKKYELPFVLKEEVNSANAQMRL